MESKYGGPKEPFESSMQTVTLRFYFGCGSWFQLVRGSRVVPIVKRAYSSEYDVFPATRNIRESMPRETQRVEVRVGEPGRHDGESGRARFFEQERDLHKGRQPLYRLLEPLQLSLIAREDLTSFSRRDVHAYMLQRMAGGQRVKGERVVRVDLR